MDEKEKLDLFLDLSVLLTGYQRVQLLGTGLAFTYFEAVTNRVGIENISCLFEAFDAIQKSYADDSALEQEVRVGIMSDAQLGPIARRIIKLWYLGQWDALPSAWRSSFGNNKSDVNQILSIESYKEGLVWQAIGAHPMGAKQTGFDSWSDPPVEPI